MGFIAHLFVAWLRTGLAADLCWGVCGHDAPGDFRKSQPPPQTAKMKFFRHRLWIIAALSSMFPAGFRINVVTSDHRVEGSSPAWCQSLIENGLDAINPSKNEHILRLHPHSILTFCVQVDRFVKGCILVFILTFPQHNPRDSTLLKPGTTGFDR